MQLNNYRKRCFYRLNGVITLLVVSLACHCIVVVSSEGRNENQNQVYQADIPSDKEQEISILIGAKNGEGEGRSGIGINADEEGGDGGGTGNSTVGGGEAASESTSWDNCENPDSNCCYQYTWPGWREVPPEAVNSTCAYLKKERKDETIACFDPMVFTEPRPGKQADGTHPDFSDLRDRARNQRWNTYCVMSGGKACVTYTYYSNSDGKMQNQTKFCGLVTTTDGKRLENGCYKQNVGGSLREVCVCKDRLCNASSQLHPSTITLLTIFILTYAFRP